VPAGHGPALPEHRSRVSILGTSRRAMPGGASADQPALRRHRCALPD
jgi:hypothetical protein